MKKSLVAIAVLVGSTHALAFDMGAWTRNSSQSENTQQNTQQAAVDTGNSQGSNQSQKQSIEDKKAEISGAIYDSFENAKHQPQQANQHNNAGATYGTNPNVRQNHQYNSGNNYGGQRPSSKGYSSQVQPQVPQQYNQKVSNQSQIPQSGQSQGVVNNQGSQELTPQMEAQINKQMSAFNHAMGQIKNITTNGYSVSSSQKSALNTFNSSVQMMAGIWVSSKMSNLNPTIDFELYNYAVACTTKKGVSNQARSLLNAYSQIGLLNGFVQHVQSRGKPIGSNGPTLGC